MLARRSHTEHQENLPRHAAQPDPRNSRPLKFNFQNKTPPKIDGVVSGLSPPCGPFAPLEAPVVLLDPSQRVWDARRQLNHAESFGP
jgi:hypothetical protein